MGDAAQVLWETDATAVNTVERLATLLHSRFSGTCQADKYRMELRIRRRQQGESLATLHQDIRRLMALAHPTLSSEGRETFACDYFIDAMDNIFGRRTTHIAAVRGVGQGCASRRPRRCARFPHARGMLVSR